VVVGLDHCLAAHPLSPAIQYDEPLPGDHQIAMHLHHLQTYQVRVDYSRLGQIWLDEVRLG